jgi:hypothetical protein
VAITTFQAKVLSPIKMMNKSKPNGDLGDKGNLVNQATPEGGGSKVTVDPQGNPVSIKDADAFTIVKVRGRTHENQPAKSW